MPRQLGFDLPQLTAFRRSDFLPAASNAMALALIEGWQSWTPRKLLLCGPDGSGKTHLAHIWSDLSGAQLVSADALTEADVPNLAGACVVVEDVHLMANDKSAQTAAFHLHNLVLAEGHGLLMTGRGVPKEWGLTLPDLESRIAGTQVARLEAPDDTLLAALLAKLFSDRQLRPKVDVIPYLVARMDRSFASARSLVAALDDAALAENRPITRQLAGQVLDNYEKNET